jgi:hypothetical protein
LLGKDGKVKEVTIERGCPREVNNPVKYRLRNVGAGQKVGMVLLSAFNARAAPELKVGICLLAYEYYRCAKCVTTSKRQFLLDLELVQDMAAFGPHMQAVVADPEAQWAQITLQCFTGPSIRVPAKVFHIPSSCVRVLQRTLGTQNKHSFQCREKLGTI